MKFKKFSQDLPTIVVFQGSPRDERSCANGISKSKKAINRVLDVYGKSANIQVIDLSIANGVVQPCRGCVSTAGGYHCHWPCDCLGPNMESNKDLLWENDVYKKLERCDAFVVVTPIHWYGPSTQVKSLFDRLVCANLTITVDEAVLMFGKGNTKNPDYTKPAERAATATLKNHLKGKYAAFLAHGDNGANERYPKPIGDEKWDPVDAIMPLVYQCRYSEIECPDEFIDCFYTNKGQPYSDAVPDEIETRLLELFEKILKKI